jgi:hypothetical protein
MDFTFFNAEPLLRMVTKSVWASYIVQAVPKFVEPKSECWTNFRVDSIP